MYESHFGLSGPPFQLNPDPSFYFGSRGHSNALAYLKFGAHQGEGFIVVTGEIGAGKTTLVRALLEGLDPAEVVAAQVVSTQLESGDLLRAILAAFGVPPSGASKAHLISTLEGFRTALAAKGRRALLIVDEAQNLDRNAVEELRMLSNFQLGTHGLLQSFLVGQPELRALLQSKSMEQLRQRVIASCHLGPLDATETRAYIEHRLHHVGWTDNPSFDPGTFDQIYRWSGGVPRRINRLCNRLLLATFLADGHTITSENVERVAQDLQAEIGDASGVRSASVRPLPPSPAADAPDGAAPASVAVAAPAVADETGLDIRQRGPEEPQKPIVCLVDSAAGYLKSGALARVFAEFPNLPPVVTVHMGSAAELAAIDDTAENFPRATLDIHLLTPPHAGAADTGTALARFDLVVDRYQPSAVLSMGSSNAVLACSLLATKKGVPLLRGDAGRRRAWGSSSAETNALLMDHVAEVLYTQSLVTHYALHKVGIASARVHCVGDLTSNVLHFVDSHVLQPDAVLRQAGVSTDAIDRGHGFAVVTRRFEPRQTAREKVAETLNALDIVRRELPVIWLMDEATLVQVKASGNEARLQSSHIVIVPTPGYLGCVSVIRAARLVLAGPEAAFLDEAVASGVPSVVIDKGTVVPVKLTDESSIPVPIAGAPLQKLVRELLGSVAAASDEPDYWDGGAAGRIAKHLSSWLPKHALRAARERRMA